MKIHLGLAVSAALGAALLIPVLVVVALGLYGESLGVLPLGSAGDEPTLSLQPERGPSNSSVLIEGRNWPPRSDVALFLTNEHSRDTAPGFAVPLTTVTASPAGAFTIELTLPPALLSLAARQVQIRAEVRRDVDKPDVSASVDFGIQPYANLVAVEVTDAATGVRLDGAEVVLRDSFGTLLASSRTGPTGMAEFAGIPPGNAASEIRLLDYERAAVEFSMAATGPTRATVSLKADPGKRLFLPFSRAIDADHLLVMALDRASGLRADEILNLDSVSPPASDPTFPSEIHFFYLLSTEHAGTPSIIEPAMPTLESMRAWGVRSAAFLRAIVARVSLLGTSADGGVVLVTEATGAGFGRGSSTWLLLDSKTGREKRRGEVPQMSFVAGLSSDRASLYVVDNSKHELAVVSLASDGTPAVVPGLPSGILRLIPDPAGSAVYLLQAGAGSVFRLHLTTGVLSGPIVSVPRATWLATDPTGTRLYLVGPGSESLTVLYGLDGPPTVRTVPLPGSATWIWADADGPHLYAGGGRSGEVVVLDADSLEIIDRHSTANLDS